MISKRPIFGSGKVPFTLFLRQRRGEGQLLITSQLCCYLKKKTYKETFLCYHCHCICTSSRVQSEIWGKNNFLSFF